VLDEEIDRAPAVALSLMLGVDHESCRLRRSL
jgi:hypothetical protein